MRPKEDMQIMQMSNTERPLGWLGFPQLDMSQGRLERGALNGENVSIRLPCRQVCDAVS